MLSPTAAAAHITALAQLTASQTKAATDGPAVASQSLRNTAAWGGAVLQAAEEVLGRFVEQVRLASLPDLYGVTVSLWKAFTWCCHLQVDLAAPACSARKCNVRVWWIPAIDPVYTLKAEHEPSSSVFFCPH